MGWYVVFRGRKPGVYDSWAGCSDQVSGYPNNSYNGFRSREEAVAAYAAYMGQSKKLITLNDSTVGKDSTNSNCHAPHSFD
ncbi:hypothetical protein ACP4OV_030114 [Aristida adscensionis]